MTKISLFLKHLFRQSKANVNRPANPTVSQQAEALAVLKGRKTASKKRRFQLPLKIRGKLYVTILFILIFNILATTFFGQTLLETFYTYNKNSELKSIQKGIKESYLSNDGLISEKINEAEKKNITIFIFSLTKGYSSANSDDTISIGYFSRSFDAFPDQTKQIPEGGGKYNPIMWVKAAYSKNVFEQLNNQTDSQIILSNQDNFSMRPGGEKGNRSLQLYSKIEEGVYLFLETPQEFITQTASLAVRYTLYISLITLGLALIIIAFVSKKFTKPISNIETVANKIANLDFTDRCRIESNDELGQLGTSINRMSETLQENIQRLTVMNAMLREDLQREEQTNKIRREFIANVSHDFKTPLSLIVAYSESIRDQEQEKEELDKQCDIIIAESNKMDGLVNQLLKLSQLENKMVTLQKSMFDLTGSIEELVYQHQILLKAKNITVEFTDREERIAYGDYSKIEQVLSNLFENAVKYTSEGGTIKIWITKDQKYTIHIFNKAKDIVDIDPSQLFISFYKHDQSRSLEDKSYGLGLAIVKAIVELHGNECGAYKEDDGIVFWFEVEGFKE